MGEIDDAGQVENEGEAERHERVERTDDQAVERIKENELRHRKTSWLASDARRRFVPKCSEEKSHSSTNEGRASSGAPS